MKFEFISFEVVANRNVIIINEVSEFLNEYVSSHARAWVECEDVVA